MLHFMKSSWRAFDSYLGHFLTTWGLVVSLTHDWSISSTFFSITFPTKNISKHQLGAPGHIVTPWIYFNLMGYLQNCNALLNFYKNGISAFKGDSYFYGLSWVSKSIPSKCLGLQKVPSTGPCSFREPRAMVFFLCSRPWALVQKRVSVGVMVCGTINMSVSSHAKPWWFPWTIGVPCILVVQRKTEVRWVSFFFGDSEKGMIGSEVFGASEGTRMMCNVFVSKNICHITVTNCI